MRSYSGRLAPTSATSSRRLNVSSSGIYPLCRSAARPVSSLLYASGTDESEYAYAVRHEMPLSLIALDLDHFKSINDTFGHPGGDYVLSEMAGVVFASIRVEDVFARVGGEEFSVICRGADMSQGSIVAERLRRSVEAKEFTWNGKRVPVTMSVGMATVPNPSIRDPMEFIAAADQVLYEAKRSGRNRVCIWNNK